MTTPFTIFTLVIIICSLWIRRITWHSRWESTITLSIALFGTGLILTTSLATATIGPLLTNYVGQPNFENYIGHVCVIAGSAAFVHGLLIRFAYGDELRPKLRRFIEIPMTTGALLLLAIYFIGKTGYVMEGGDSFYADLYHIVLCAMVIYLLGYAGRALLELRTHPTHQVMADLYLFGCVSGIGACGVRMADRVAPPVQAFAGGTHMVAILTTLWMGSVASAAAYSWNQKTRPLKRFKEVVG